MRPAPGSPPRHRLHVLQVVSEVAPFSKTGGLADVASALPRALARLGVKVTVVTPLYGTMDVARHALARRLEPISVPLGHRHEPVALHEGHLPGGKVSVFFLDHPFFQRARFYGDEGRDYEDNGVRFALLCRGALEVAHRLNLWPDVVHAHDWQGGLACLYAKRQVPAGRPTPTTVFTIHNLAFQGLQPRGLLDELGLGWDLWHPDGVEFFDQLSCLKAGASFADVITTVSPHYAREIQTPEHGIGLDGYLRARASRIVGILNGVDVESWSPAHDPNLTVRYDADDPSGKSACKATLQRELGLPVRTSVPIVASISRLTDQKGFDLVAGAAEDLARLDAQFVFLASGEKRFEEALARLRDRNPTKVALRLGQDEPLAHRIIGGADLLLMPSRFEPCGLNQLYAMRYGTVPIVRGVGGLEDTIVDYDELTGTGSGFKFQEYSPAALVSALKRALGTYRRRNAWEALVRGVMALDFTWEASAGRYLEAYERARPGEARAAS